MKNIYEVQQSNKIKSLIVIFGFVLFIAASVYLITQAMSVYLGFAPGGLGFLGISLIVSGFATFVSYYWSDKIVLGISGARPASRKRDFMFYTVTENMCLASRVPMPKLYIIDDSAPNAFATGRDPEHASVCATTGILDKLNRTELEGVIAHELTHVKNYDIRLMSLVSVMVGTLALLADWLIRMSWFGGRRKDDEQSSAQGIILLLGIVFAILSPIIAQLIQLAISRRREFMADAGAVAITRQPSGLISALKKISGDAEPLEAANKATAHMYIVNPFKNVTGARANFSGLFNTHPPLSERIKALESMM